MKMQNFKEAICHNCGDQGHKSTFCQKNKIGRE